MANLKFVLIALVVIVSMFAVVRGQGIDDVIGAGQDIVSQIPGVGDVMGGASSDDGDSSVDASASGSSGFDFGSLFSSFLPN